MHRLAKRWMYTVAGGCGGLAGFAPAAGCSGGGCTACYGCLGAGALVFLLACLSKRKKNGQGEEIHGMDEIGN